MVAFEISSIITNSAPAMPIAVPNYKVRIGMAERAMRLFSIAVLEFASFMKSPVISTGCEAEMFRVYAMFHPTTVMKDLVFSQRSTKQTPNQTMSQRPIRLTEFDSAITLTIDKASPEPTVRCQENSFLNILRQSGKLKLIFHTQPQCDQKVALGQFVCARWPL